jgi:hypothetical protein
MQVKIEYIAEITIGDLLVPVYVTEDSRVYVNMDIMNYIKLKHQIKQLIITDIDDTQYFVYPFVEVCKYINRDVVMGLNTGKIRPKKHKKIESKEPSEFVLTLKNLVKPRNKEK